MSTAAIYRIKAAQQQLVALCGGIGDATLRDQFGRSTLGRWQDTGDPTLMPLNAVMAMERMCGQPLVTAALAELSGRRLADPEAEVVPQQQVMSRHAEAIVQAGELMAAGAAAFADGVDPVDYDRTARRLVLADLDWRDCRWPVNEAAPRAPHLFCGRPAAEGHRYCAHHALRARGVAREAA